MDEGAISFDKIEEEIQKCRSLAMKSFDYLNENIQSFGHTSLSSPRLRRELDFQEKGFLKSDSRNISPFVRDFQKTTQSTLSFSEHELTSLFQTTIKSIKESRTYY